MEESVGTSIAYVRTFVRAYLSERVQQARNSIAEYGDRYQVAMLAALETSSQGIRWLCRTAFEHIEQSLPG